MQTWEQNHVSGELRHVFVEVGAWEPVAGSDSRHCRRDRVVQIGVVWLGISIDLHINMVDGLIINPKHLVSIFYKLIYGKDSIVWFKGKVWSNFWRWNHSEGSHCLPTIIFS